MANIDSFAFEYVQVDIDQVEHHPFGEPVTPETMQRDLQKIGSLEAGHPNTGRCSISVRT